MKRTPGPLDDNDIGEIEAFQLANDCQIDGDIGRETKDAIWARMARADKPPLVNVISWPLLIFGFIFGGLTVALLF